MNDPKRQFGKKLKALRAKRGWSRERLAFECNMDRSYIGGVERGERNIALVNICRIAECLNINPSILFNFDEKDS